MKVNSTELQNNFGKYLMLAAQEDIIITRNGTEIAKLTALDDKLQDHGSAVNQIHENAPTYSYGKKATYEYWIVNPDNKEVTVYLFAEQNIQEFTTFKQNEIVQSYLFEKLQIAVQRIFR